MRNLLLICVLCISSGTFAQNPCSGTPGANTVVPLSQTICAGTSINLNLANTYSTTGITYQWQSSTVSVVGPYTNILGGTTKAFTTPTLGGTTYFNVVITCTNSGLSISVPYVLTVVPCNTPCAGAPAPSSITPASQTVCIANVAAMSLSNNYTQTGVSYQWAVASNPAGPFATISGATLSSYVSPTINTTAYYNVVITCTNSGLSYTTGTATVSAVSCTMCSGTPASNTILPNASTVCAGSSVNFSLATTYSASGYTYQWQTSTVSPVGPFQPVQGVGTSTLATPNLFTTSYYNLVITCTNSGMSISIPQVINVMPCNQPCTGAPASTGILPLSPTVCAGASLGLSLSNSYSNTGITYQWGSTSIPGGSFTPISGATLNAYATTTLSGTTFYNVLITCTNSNQSFTTTQTITVISCSFCSGAPAANTVIPISPTICAGTSQQLSLATTYSGSGYTFQWQSSSVSAVGPFQTIAGANTASYNTPTLSTLMYYNVVITCTNSGQTLSVPCTVYVMPCQGLCTGTPASNTVLPLTHTLCAGIAASMSLAATYTETGITYQWFMSGSASGPFAAIPAATLSSLTSSTLNSTSYFNVVITCSSTNQSYTASHVVNVVTCSGSTSLRNELNETEGIRMYPNPTDGNFTIETADYSNKKVSVTTLLGEHIQQFSSTEKIIHVDVSQVPNGLYLIFIEVNGAQKVIKLKKE